MKPSRFSDRNVSCPVGLLGSSRLIWLVRRRLQDLVGSRETSDSSQWEAAARLYSVAVVATEEHSDCGNRGSAWGITGVFWKDRRPENNHLQPSLNKTGNTKGKVAIVLSRWLLQTLLCSLTPGKQHLTCPPLLASACLIFFISLAGTVLHYLCVLKHPACWLVLF